MSKQVNYNENLCAGAAIRDDKGRRISKLFEASHPKMTVGYAKNLIMPDDPTEQEFNFRQAGGGVIEDGVAVIDKVKGNSVVWNQLVSMKASGTTETLNGVTITYTDNGFLLQGTATKAFRFTDLGTCNLKEGHKYLTFGGSSGTSLQVEQWGGSPIDSRGGQPAIVTISTTPTALGRINIYCLAEQTFVGKELHWQFCDLTQMFGAGNEPSTYEEFLSRKPKVADEFAYNEGTIVNNKVEAVVTTGRNLWDEEWENGYIDVNNGGEDKPMSTTFRSKNYIPVLSGTTLYVNKGTYSASLTLVKYNTKKEYVGFESIYANSAIEMPSNVAFIRFYLEPGADTSTYNHNICINLSDPAINGKYFPYEKHELDLSWVKEIKDTEGVKLFEDGMRSAGTAFDEVGKNKAVKRIGIKVFDGTEPLNSFEVKDDQTAVKAEYTFLTTTLEGSRYARVVGAGFYGQYNGGYYYDLWAAGFASIRSLIICLPYSVAKSGTEVKEYLKAQYNAGTPLIVYYELAEPIVVEYDEKNLTYPVVAGGTEEAIASEPSTAFRADIGYGIDAVKTILDLKARVEALEAK